MKNQNVKDILYGMIVGIIGLAAGIVLMIGLFMGLNNVKLDYVKTNMALIFSNSPLQMATGILLINFILFYIFMRKEKYFYSQGVMVICILVIICALLY